LRNRNKTAAAAKDVALCKHARLVATGNASVMEAGPSAVLAHVDPAIPASGMTTGTRKAGVIGKLPLEGVVGNEG